jgi:hypothetical protein
MEQELHIPTLREFSRGCKAFQTHEHRDAMYKTASFLVEHFWGKPRQIADGLGVLLLTWNQAFYRYGPFSFDQLERCIKRNSDALGRFRPRHILDFVARDATSIRYLFREFLAALAIADGPRKGVRSPVAASKALHLMAPSFFPLWDDKISRSYRCHYSKNPDEKYVLFFLKMRSFAAALPRSMSGGLREKTLLKLIDEYNYAKYTKGWI